MPRFRMYPLKSNNVVQLYEWRDQIDLDPPYQRISVWEKEQKQSFIDSVINGFDIPKIYFHEIPPQSDKANKYKYSVIDGKQRMLALWGFMSNEVTLPPNFVFFEDEGLKAAGRKYSQLMSDFPRLRARFDSFDLPITVVKSDDEDFIDELFTRLNTQFSLSAPELRNALGGPIPMLIRKVGHSAFLTESVDITNRRLQHFDLAAKFLYLTRADDFVSVHRRVLNGFVANFRKLRQEGDESASKAKLDELEDDTQKILERMHNFFRKEDSLLTSQGRTTLFFHVFRLYNTVNQNPPFTREMLAQFDDELVSARKKSQRISEGSGESLTHIEQLLVFFDREKQSLNDGKALLRQYGYLKDYMALSFGVNLVSIP